MKLFKKNKKLESKEQFQRPDLSDRSIPRKNVRQRFASIGSIIPVLVIVASLYDQFVGYSFRERSADIFHEFIQYTEADP